MFSRKLRIIRYIFPLFSALSSRGLGPWGPDLVRRYTSARFGSYSSGDMLTEEEGRLLTGNVNTLLLSNIRANILSLGHGFFTFLSFLNEDYVYHTLAAKASGELCLKYIFSFGAFARKPLLQRLALVHFLISSLNKKLYLG